MKSPIPSEFQIDAGSAQVRVTHTPTKTEISFLRNQETGALLGPISTNQGAPFGDSAETEVTTMARRIAERVSGGARRLTD